MGIAFRSATDKFAYIVPTSTLTVDELMTILARGADVNDEPGFDVLTHSLQTAEILAEAFPDDPELICAGLVHDIADAVEPNGHIDHEKVGSALVADLLGPRVAALVGGHVAAKRYLAAVEPGYALSERSATTLEEQGGAMSPSEVTAFEARPDLDALIHLRHADDCAKDLSRPVRPLESWRPMLDRVAGR